MDKSGTPFQSGLWTLRPGDLPGGALRNLPHLRGLEENPAYRLLVFQSKRHGRRRAAMLAVYVAAWIVVGAPYCMAVFGAPADLAFLYSLVCAAVMTFGIANLFWLAGIEGYETNGRLKPYFADLVQTGIGGERIAQAIVGISVSRVNFTAVRAAVAGGGASLVGMMLLIAGRRGLPYIHWIGFLGVFGSAHLFMALAWPESLVLPGAVTWLGGVRRSYQRILSEDPLALSTGAAALGRLIGFLAATLAVSVVPLASYLLLGVLWTRGYPGAQSATLRLAAVAAGAALALVAGLSTGRLWRSTARSKAPGLRIRLAAELDHLFDLRRERIHERGPVN